MRPRARSGGWSPELAAIAIVVVATPTFVWLALPVGASSPQPAPAARSAFAVRPRAEPPLTRAAVDARAVVAVPAVDDTGDRAEERRGAEDAHYARFVAEWYAGGESRRGLEGEPQGRLRSSESDIERVAFLRALRDVHSPASDDALAFALRELPDVSGPHGVSVPAFVVSYLGRAAELTDAERSVLEEAVRARHGNLGANTRGRALCVLLERSDEAQLPVLSGLVESEPDPLVRAMGEQARRERQASDERARGPR